MPSSPTGGLSIFVNLAILVISTIFCKLKKLGFSSKILQFIGIILISKRYNTVLRRISAYSIVFLIAVTLTTVVTISMAERLKNSSNFIVVSETLLSLNPFNHHETEQRSETVLTDSRF